ncbi:MAG: class I SAM-dependent methyltransferase [Bacteroidales bacterium]
MTIYNIYRKQLFNPNFFSLFINPFFIIRRNLYKCLKTEAPKLSGKVLDFGCGSKPYKSLFVNAVEYIGLDIENEGHSHEKEDIDFYYDGKTIPFGNEVFDSVFSSEVFEHIFELDNSLDEISRVLKKNGKLLISLPFAWNEHEIPNDFARYTSFGIIYLLEKHGFKVASITKAGHFAEVVAQFVPLYIYELIATKKKFLNLFLNLFFISPFIVVGFLVSHVLPVNKSLYFNNVILAEKK